MKEWLDRLQGEAARQGETLAQAVRHHLLEGVVRRVARLPDGAGLVLRGGLLTRFWIAPRPRPTRDLDFVGDFPFDLNETVRRFAPVLTTSSDDGISWDANQFAGQGIWLETKFPGVRLTMRLGLGTPDQTVSVDIGFGDPLVPPAVRLEYPTRTSEPPVRIRACRPETQVAWKLHCLAEMGVNWRPKDLADLWLISRGVALVAADLTPAVEAAFVSRGYPVTDAVAVLQRPHWGTKTARVRWTPHRAGLPELSQVVADVRESLAPALAALTVRERTLEELAVSKENPLLPAILAAPDDDAPRLIFADWLEEQGDSERAEFIRAQCETARLPAWDRRRQELTWRADALWSRHGKRWHAELPALKGVEWLEFERGFVSTVRVPDVATLYRHDKAIARTAPVHRAELSQMAESKTPRPEGAVPWLRTLRLSHQYHQHEVHPERSLLGAASTLELVRLLEGADLSWLVAGIGQSKLTQLRIQGEHTVGGTFAAQLAETPWFRGLTDLDLGTRFVDYNSGYFEDPTLGTAGLRTLIQSKHAPRLTALNLNRQRIGISGLQTLLASSRLTDLRELEVRANEISDLKEIRRWAGGRLVRLDLSENAVGDAGMDRLATEPELSGLECLDLDTCEVGPKGIEVLSKAPFWDGLRRLDLSRNPLGATGAWALASARPPARLHTLRLTDCDLDAEAGKALAAAPWLRELQTLDLSSNDLEAPGTAALAALAGGALRRLSLAKAGLVGKAAACLGPLLPQLVSLDLGDNALGASGLQALFEGGTAPNLQHLRLRNCGLGERCLELLASPEVCPQLHSLTLARNPLSVKELRRFLEGPAAGRLVELDLFGCGLTAEAATLLAEAAMLAGLTRLNLRGNEFGEQGLLALARSAILTGVRDLRLDGASWQFAVATRKFLADRFGPQRNYHDDEEDATIGEPGAEIPF